MAETKPSLTFVQDQETHNWYVSGLPPPRGQLSYPLRFFPPTDTIKTAKFTARITSETGELLFEQRDIEAPASWSQTAVDIVASKYFRGHIGTPERETSVIQVIDRIVSTIRSMAVQQMYFEERSSLGREALDNFCSDLRYLLITQRLAFNSPVWFNLGVQRKPQSSACFINSVEDSMESIMELAKTEARLFKSGSGSGVNISTIRPAGAKTTGGGVASGPLSFMRGLDSFAGAIKSGGRTRRSAKMVIMNLDHPDVGAFIECKALEEKKVQALIDAGYDGSFNGEAYATVAYQNANHSIRVTDEQMRKIAARQGREYDLFRQAAEAAWASGDPGVQFDTITNAWHTTPSAGRINASNPCQPAWAKLLTPDGIRTMGEIQVGDIIWSGQQWTRVKRKIETGVKPVFEYRTSAGVFVGTENHRVISRGERVEVRNAETIDVARGPQPEKRDLHAQAVLDGLMVGDGSMVYANGGANLYPILYVGAKDKDYFESEVAALINPIPYDGTAHRAETTLQPDDLVRTFERQVPEKYLRASADVACSFLRGLFSANGSVCGHRVTLKAASARLIDQVRTMLSALGIGAYVTTNQGKDVEFANGTYACRESYDLNITAHRHAFAELIGFIQSDKNERLAATNPSAKAQPRKSSYEIRTLVARGNHTVWDIEVEAEEHTYWTDGLLVSNCSEFVYLDDTACNLASLNLVKFWDGSTFDVAGFGSAVEVAIIAMDLLVDGSSYPTKKIAERSHRYRPLGLGYANLGALLMRAGLAYDSDEGRRFASAITRLMHARAYATSAILAEELGENPYLDADDVMHVLRKHRDARTDWAEGLSDLYDHADASYHVAIETARKVRNGQVTVLAPTGTISFMMDCDTTGIEPDIALVKYKRLVGGGMLKIVNQSVDAGLQRLGYSAEEREQIIAYVHDNDTIEGAPGLKEKDLPVFDCALRPAKGKRSIAPMGHVKMMAACQPHLSGAISKTVNMPADATVDDIFNIYLESWRLGLKAVAVYRDGCKRSQPLNVKREKAEVVEVKPARRHLPDERKAVIHKFSVGGHEGYLSVGFFDDGTPGEVFITMSKEGSTIRGLMDTIATQTSIALQYGVPLSALVDKFMHARFEPSGFTGNPDIPMAASIVDYMFRWLRRYVSDEAAPSAGPAASTGSTGSAEVPRSVAGDASDGVACSNCGGVTVRAGSCHVCPVCGTTSGCS